MIKNLQKINALSEQHFDEKMVAQVETKSKQLKFLLRELKLCRSMNNP